MARPDVAEISMSMASITGSTFTTGKYVALNNATGEYKTEAAGTGENTYDNVFSIEVYASSSDVPSGHSAEAAVILTNIGSLQKEYLPEIIKKIGL